MDVNSLFNVKGKVVLVTGGGKGIGRMISEGYVTNGAKVYISSRDAKACEAAAAELSAIGSKTGGGTAIALPADLQSLDQCKKLAEELAKRESKLHVLVNNSGAAWGADFDSHPDSAWTKVMTLNVQRVFTMTQLLAPLLQAAAGQTAETEGQPVQDPARVINIGSIDGIRVPTLPNFGYSASKAALHHLGRTLAVELGPRGITTNTIACGPFPSKMFKPVFDRAFLNGAIIRLDGGISQLARL
ncbi:putative short chain dehydrogenase reductase family protein [Phaeoacremonium minimum UCRPA7]|uniref:Putative short chain dehydrogenase reductase family protein n=1 Tax=Phaeoacremonium minimum (strain UCR-PA7) TaxID=1286976 RepID=R8BKS5_PHAM7|nr:putative short chain dehydrogenase reductase family protein [Phaeoacremonium minimum UCRPA7]EON99911.1 putative short chain dehydrogenase reductase family protein [Phaeoacremonium minimum UCRPA7]